MKPTYLHPIALAALLLVSLAARAGNEAALPGAGVAADPTAWSPEMTRLMANLDRAVDYEPARLNDSLYVWGEAGDRLSDPEQIVYFGRCVALAERAGHFPLQIEMMRELSSPYRHLDSIKQSFDLLYEAVALAERYDSTALGRLRHKLGWSCYENYDYVNAISHFRTATADYARCGQTIDRLWTWLSLMRVYFEREEYDAIEAEGSAYFAVLDSLPGDTDDPELSVSARAYRMWGYTWLAVADVKRGRYARARAHWLAADSLAGGLPPAYSVSQVLQRLVHGEGAYSAEELYADLAGLEAHREGLSSEQLAVLHMVRGRLLLAEGASAAAAEELARAEPEALEQSDYLATWFGLRERAALETGDTAVAYATRLRFDSVQARRHDTQEASRAAYYNGRLRLQHIQDRLARLDTAEAAMAYERTLRKRSTILGVLGVAFLAVLLAIAASLYRGKAKSGARLEHMVAAKTADLTRRNEELERFNHVLAHDLKEPLRSIVSFSQLAARRNEDDAVGEYLAYATASARQLDDLVTGMLGYQEEPEATRALGSLQALAEAAAADLRKSQPRKQISLTAVDLPAELSLPAAVLSESLRIVFANAALFNDNEYVELTLQYVKRGREHVLTVTDNGIGIAEEYHESVFEMFRRLHVREAYPGAGVGLSRLRRILEPVKGGAKITSSALGFGTTIALSWRDPAKVTRAKRTWRGSVYEEIVTHDREEAPTPSRQFVVKYRGVTMLPASELVVAPEVRREEDEDREELQATQ